MKNSNERKETSELRTIRIEDEKFSYTMVRRQTGKKVQWYPIYNDKRFSRTLFSSKWEAQRFVIDLVTANGIAKVNEIFTK